MREIRAACFSARGEALGRRLGVVTVTRFPGDVSLADWTREGFQRAQALVFIGACQIAVRAIAPCVHSKLTDPAVVVIDETGRYVIPLLGGHAGGANDLASHLSGRLGAHAVLTTATDRRHAFAPDSWAAETGLGVVNPEAVKRISAAVLDGEQILIGVCGKDTPEGGAASFGSLHCDGDMLRLVPRTVVIGAGCRRGIDPDHLEQCFLAFCARHGIEAASVLCLASIDLKKEEPALLSLAGRRKLLFRTYSARQLMETEGAYSSSGFVLQTTGTDNVCERAAVRAALELDMETWEEGSFGDGTEDAGMPEGAGSGMETEGAGRLMIPKEAWEGVTLAASRVTQIRSWRWT